MDKPTRITKTATKLPVRSEIDKLRLDKADAKTLQEGLASIRKVLEKRNVNIEDIIGLVTVQEVKGAANHVMIRFSEGTTSQMNMVAFD